MASKKTYNKYSSFSDISAEKDRLRRKIRKQEQVLTKDWERIEDGWKLFNKIGGIVGNLASSATIVGGADIGYRILSHFLKKKKVKI